MPYPATIDQAEPLGRHRGGADAQDREDGKGQPQRQPDGCRGLGDLLAEPPVFLGLGLVPLDVGPAALGGGARARADGRGFAGSACG